MKSIALPTKVINLFIILTLRFATCDFIFFFFLLSFFYQVCARKRVCAASLGFFARPEHRRSYTFSCFSRCLSLSLSRYLSLSLPLSLVRSLFFSPSPLSRSNESGTMGRLDRWGDDSVQRGVRNFHARTSRRGTAPTAHTSETYGGVVACRCYHRGCIVYV